MHGEETFFMELVDVGPLLANLLKAQCMDEELLAYPQVESLAGAVVDRAAGLNHPLLLPVGEAGHRLLAVVETLSRGELDVPVWNWDPRDRVVLLVGTVGVSMAEFHALTRRLRKAGAAGVHGVAVRGGCFDEPHELDSFVQLDVGCEPYRRSA
jgi:hypothetical protein